MPSGAHFDDQSLAEKGGGAGAPRGAPPPAGDGGQPPLAGIAEGLDPLNTDSVKKFSADAQRVKDLADAGPAGGGFAISPEAGQQFISAISKYLDETWMKITHDVANLANHPELGSGAYSQQVATHDASVMQGDEQSLIPNLQRLQDGLVALRSGIETAIGNYREEDEANSAQFKAVDLG